MTADQLADKTDLADANGSATVLPCLLTNAQQGPPTRDRPKEPSSIFFQLPPTAWLASRTSNKKTLWHWALARDYICPKPFPYRPTHQFIPEGISKTPRRSCSVESQNRDFTNIKELQVTDHMNRRDLLKLAGMGVAVFASGTTLRERGTRDKVRDSLFRSNLCNTQWRNNTAPNNPYSKRILKDAGAND